MGQVVRLITACVLATAWIGAQAAMAAPQWSKPVVVTHTCKRGTGTHIQAAQNARGDALVAWVERCYRTLDDGRWRVVAVSRKAGHRRFGGRRILHSGGRPAGIRLGIALDKRGGGTVAWTRTAASNSTRFPDTGLLIATRRPGGRFSRPRLVDEHGGAFDLDANALGETLLSWVHFDPPNTYERSGAILVAIRPAGGTDFGLPQAVTATAVQVGAPLLDIADDGTAIAVWHRGATDNPETEAAIRPPGGPFGTPARLGSATPFSSRAVAVSGQSTGIVAWSTVTETTSPGWGSSIPPGGVFVSRGDGQAFSSPIALVRDYNWFGVSDILLGRDGRATIEWDQGYSRDNCIGVRPPPYALTLSSNGPPGASAMILPPNGMRFAFASALDANDRLIRIWFQDTARAQSKYDCFITAGRVGASIDGGPTIAGPAIQSGPNEIAFTAAVAPTLVWAVRGRIVTTTFRETP